jgi:glycosyltransferase involved in cell wall biosynthesis
MSPRVLFVSKPIAPPFRDGTKCLVRDIALGTRNITPILMSTPSAPALEGSSRDRPIELVPVYSDSGAYEPKFGENARAAAYLLLRARADIWHFVFAPNPRSSLFGRWLGRARRVPVVQTIASPPKNFDRVSELLFGDVVVAQSQWTRTLVERADRENSRGRRRRVEVIRPPVGSVRSPTLPAQLKIRQEIGVSETAPLFVYPGDLEVSSGARLVSELVKPLAEKLPDVVVVFAFRNKTERAAAVAEELEGRLDRNHVRFVSDVDDILALLTTSVAVLFPVDDLFGKVDLPIVLLEAMSLGVPVVALDEGPLRELDGAVLIGRDRAQWLEAALDLAANPDRRHEVSSRQREHISRHHRPDVVASAYEAIYHELLGLEVPRSVRPSMPPPSEPRAS